MATLLHIDASIRQEGSVSRQVSGAFAEHWRTANPDGEYVYRDLGATPVPHFGGLSQAALYSPEEDHSDQIAADWAISKELIAELQAADTVVIGVPMYNFSIPSALKAWLDRIITPQAQKNQETGVGAYHGKQVIVVNSRGGAYGPGTPRADFEFQERYLRAVLSFIDLDGDLTFVNAEMTLADVVPALAQFKDFAAESLETAHRTVRELATATVGS
jgi:FMN-dependent NADH-azoreductase